MIDIFIYSLVVLTHYIDSEWHRLYVYNWDPKSRR